MVHHRAQSRRLAAAEREGALGVARHHDQGRTLARWPRRRGSRSRDGPGGRRKNCRGRGKLTIPEGATVIDLGDATLLPGSTPFAHPSHRKDGRALGGWVARTTPGHDALGARATRSSCCARASPPAATWTDLALRRCRSAQCDQRRRDPGAAAVRSRELRLFHWRRGRRETISEFILDAPLVKNLRMVRMKSPRRSGPISKTAPTSSRSWRQARSSRKEEIEAWVQQYSG